MDNSVRSQFISNFHYRRLNPKNNPLITWRPTPTPSPIPQISLPRQAAQWRPSTLHISLHLPPRSMQSLMAIRSACRERVPLAASTLPPPVAHLDASRQIVRFCQRVRTSSERPVAWLSVSRVPYDFVREFL